MGTAQGLPEPPFGAARLPHGNAEQIEAEQRFSEVRTEKGKAEIQKEVFWSRDILFLKGEGPGSRVDVTFSVKEKGNYEVTAQVAHNRDYGIYTVLLDGKPASRPGQGIRRRSSSLANIS